MYRMTARDLVMAIRDRRIGVEELTKEYLKRIEKYDGPAGLNTVAELNENVIEQARKMDSMKSGRSGAVFGLPVLVKDNIDVCGLHTTAGSLALKDNVAVKDAHIIENLRRNGALILGKTNMTEFANYTGENMPGGYSSRGGQVKNAYDQEKSPGGSSSGSAVAMSAGLCAGAIGTDTSFSIIGCVTENGVTGIKPAHGALSSKGIIPISRTLDSAGTITRNLQDGLLVYSAMRDNPLQHIEPMAAERIHLAVNTFNRDCVSKEQLARYDKVLNRLKDAGTEISEVSHAGTQYQRHIMRFEFRHDLEEYLGYSRAKLRTLKEIIDYYETNPDQMMKYGDKLLRGALEGVSGKLDDELYIEAMAERENLQRQIIDNLNRYDACIMTGPTNIMHFTGLPSLALGLCMAEDGTPRGIILYGADEQRLFSAAMTIEKYCEVKTPDCY